MTLRNNTDTKSPLTLKKRVFTEKAQELLGVGRTFLMEKKANGEFKVGIHWVYSSGRPKSRILWDIPAIQKWQEEKSIEHLEAATKTAENIENRQRPIIPEVYGIPRNKLCGGASLYPST